MAQYSPTGKERLLLRFIKMMLTKIKEVQDGLILEKLINRNNFQYFVGIL